MCGGGGESAPPVPPAPERKEQAKRPRRDAGGGRSRLATLLSSPQGVQDEAELAKKTLLGA